ncbi:CynX/NimT family MFS transporter [Cohnella sp. GbtcB17]|uniref:MFS transporter n=1 Tax=Cohnella sp. GbtcB17 TaxID=2824762 RepID=UPI001C2FA24C|nr:MFS transporter [Cohnella sp. GbtcB17]
MKKRFYLFALCMAALNLRPIITSAAVLLGTIQSQLEMNALTASLLTTLPVLCMGIFSPVATVISHRIGLERTVFFSLILITLATVLRGSDSSVMMLLVTALAGGIGISLAGPMLSSFIKKYFPERPDIVSVYSISMTVGAALASGFTIPIYTRSGHNLLFALSCWAIPGLLALMAWLALVRRKHHPSNATTRQKLPIANKKAIQLTVFFGLMASMFYSMTAWISPIARSFGYSPASSAMFLTIFTMIQIPIAWIVPRVVKRYGKPKLLLVLCSLSELIGVGMLLLQFPMLPAVLFLGIGAGGLFPLALMLPISETRTAEEAGTWSAMSQMGGYVMGACGPLLMGWIYDQSGSFKSSIFAMLLIVMAMIAVQVWMTVGSKEAEGQVNH